MLCADYPNLGSILRRPTQNKEGVKGRYWFMDADVKDGALTGKTGKTILTVLRHLGRLQEVRSRLPSLFTDLVAKVEHLAAFSS